MLLSGLSGIIVIEIYAAVMQREFQNTDNQVGKGFAVLGIYLFVVAYCKRKPPYGINRRPKQKERKANHNEMFPQTEC